MTRFSYVNVKACICGAALRDQGRVVSKQVAWGEVAFRHCVDCGSFIQSPQVAGESLAAWYDSPEYHGGGGRAGSVYHDYIGDEGPRLIEAEARVDNDLVPLLPEMGGRVLEIGCATGSLLKTLADRGHSVLGIDLSASFSEYGRERYGIDIRCADFMEVDLPSGGFDLVVLLGTLSNLQACRQSLVRIHSLLAPGGRVFANFPAADSLPARLYGSRFWMFTPSVSSFMSRSGARALFSATGFNDIRMRMDRQRPSLGKLLQHAKLAPLIGLIERLFGTGARLPFPLPIPGIVSVTAQRS